MDTNTVAAVTAFGNKLDGYIAVLADKVGVAADHFWPVLVQHQVIEGWGGVGTLLISILGLLMAVKILIRFLPGEQDNNFSPKQFVGTTAGISSVILFISVCINASELPNNVGKIVNPEFSAVSSLITMVK